MTLPALFLERLHKIVPAQHIQSVVETFSQRKTASFRLNSLKGDLSELQEFLANSQIIQVRTPPWYPLAFLPQGIESTVVSRWDLANQGKIYIQSLSSMLPAVVLDPQPGEVLLDLCAAPGSKTTQMAAAMQNKGRIVAVEAIRDRFFRLKSVIALMGAEIVETKCMDGRRFRWGDELFDRVLVDAPCSSEGRFKSYDKKSIGYWNLRKIREMVKKQRGLLLNACRLLRPGGVLVYSTCTFAPEENEGVVSWVLRKMEGEVALAPIETQGFERYPALSEWEGKTFDAQAVHCCRVLPTSTMEGFFMAKFTKR
jgi:tRNA (cytosine49-C5)-methyltransferase